MPKIEIDKLLESEELPSTEDLKKSLGKKAFTEYEKIVEAHKDSEPARNFLLLSKHISGSGIKYGINYEKCYKEILCNVFAAKLSKTQDALKIYASTVGLMEDFYLKQELNTPSLDVIYQKTFETIQRVKAKPVEVPGINEPQLKKMLEEAYSLQNMILAKRLDLQYEIYNHSSQLLLSNSITDSNELEKIREFQGKALMFMEMVLDTNGLKNVQELMQFRIEKGQRLPEYLPIKPPVTLMSGLNTIKLDSNSYNLTLLSMKQGEEVDESKLKQLFKTVKMPILIEKEGAFSIYGWKNPKWQITELNDLAAEQKTALYNLFSQGKSVLEKTNPLLTPLILKSLKMGHEPPQTKSLLIRGVKNEILRKNKKLLEVNERSKELDRSEQATSLSPDERDEYRVIFNGGKVYQRLFDNSFKLYDTSENKSKYGAEYAAFVLNNKGELSLFNHTGGNKPFYHSSPNAQAYVFSAGELKIENGQITEITTQSGHYHPDRENIAELLRYLKKLKVDISKIKITILNPAAQTVDDKYKHFRALDIIENPLGAKEIQTKPPVIGGIDVTQINPSFDSDDWANFDSVLVGGPPVPSSSAKSNTNQSKSELDADTDPFSQLSHRSDRSDKKYLSDTSLDSGSSNSEDKHLHSGSSSPRSPGSGADPFGTDTEDWADFSQAGTEQNKMPQSPSSTVSSWADFSKPVEVVKVTKKQINDGIFSASENATLFGGARKEIENDAKNKIKEDSSHVKSHKK